MAKLRVQLNLMLTYSQTQASINVDALLNTIADCLHFVTKFFEVISQSATHIYHSALLLTLQSSIVWRLYGQQVYSPVERVVVGVPALWDSCTASVGTVGAEKLHCVAWSPCGQFIAAAFGRAIQVQDSNTLESVSVLKPPHSLSDNFPQSLTFSPDGHLLACFYLG